MARICVERIWYEQVEPSTFDENEFELRVAVHAPSVYPFFHVLQFKKTLNAPDDTSSSGYSQVIPDLILIARDYCEWWVGEVEMGYHNFNTHVKPQVTKLLLADYGHDEVNYLCNKYDFLERDRLLRLITNSPARVMLIANQNMPEWRKYWDQNQIALAVFELFRSDVGNEIFRVNGEYPSIIQEKISDCSFHPVIARVLKINDPAKLNVPKTGFLRMLFNNCLTEWRRIDEGNDVWLTANGRDPLNREHSYSIYRQNDGQLVLSRIISAEKES